MQGNLAEQNPMKKKLNHKPQAQACQENDFPKLLVNINMEL